MQFYFILLSLIGFSLPFPCETGGGNKCFYIRANLGTGSKNGSDWNNAANSVPSTLQRGWKYYLAKGKYGSLNLNDPENLNQLISIISATSTSHGSDVGWNNSFAGQVGFDGISFYKGFYTVDGQVGGGPTSLTSGYGIKISADFTAHYGTLISFYNRPSNITLTHAEITPFNTNYYVSAIYNGGINGVLSYLYIHDLYGTPFHSFGQWTGLLIEYCYIARTQSDERHSEGFSDGGSDDVTVRYNLWEDVSGTAVIAQINGPGDAKNWDVYGNVFSNTEKKCTNSTGTCHLTTYDAAGIINVIQDDSNNVTATNWRVYHNSFVNLRGFASLSFGYGSKNVKIYNNLWWCNYTFNYTHYAYIDVPSTSTYDYNFYTKCVFPYAFQMGAHEPPKVEFWAATKTSIDIDPFVDWRAKDYRLTAPLAGYPGLALDTLSDGSQWNRIDVLGATRGADGVWDRGALEYH